VSLNTRTVLLLVSPTASVASIKRLPRCYMTRIEVIVE
jgi:hypothetical protein